MLADLGTRLPAGHVAAWATILRASPSPRTADDAQRIAARLVDAAGGHAFVAGATALVTSWRRELARHAQDGAADDERAGTRYREGSNVRIREHRGDDDVTRAASAAAETHDRRASGPTGAGIALALETAAELHARSPR
ncbi:hypothetical protein [Frankia nepalensis]|uniref:hypothetical protein n=1 Tax=Frankia nepalensis TaxID=1836974 RepID=UPI00193462B4|nr:hypothetical protein [Frankia nepalensis]MBL7515997.1 hypothetical protein [Frankia nepalensis]